MRTALLAIPLLIALGAAAILQAPAALAQTPDVRVFGTWEEPVKLDDGAEVIRRYELVYDYRRNEATLTTFAADGRMLSTELTAAPPVPHPDEKTEAIALIHADGELANVISRIADPVVHGGFIYFDGDCASLRCLQFAIEPADGSSLERFVVVDLSGQAIVERDLYPHLRD